MIKFAQKTADGMAVVYLGLSKMNVKKLCKEDDPIIVLGRDLGIGDILECITIGYEKVPVPTKIWGNSMAIKLSKGTVRILKKDGIVIRNPKFPKGLDAILLDYGETPVEIMKKLEKQGIHFDVVKPSFGRGPLL